MRKLSVAAAIAAFVLLAMGGAWAQQSSGHPSKPTSDVLKMAAAGLGQDLLLSYVQNSRADFLLDADDIIGLKDAKVDASVIKAMLSHGAAVSAAPSSTRETKPAPLNPDPEAWPGGVPAPMEELLPIAPGHGYFWVPGYWSWDGVSWIWIYGTWHPRMYPFGWHHRRF